MGPNQDRGKCEPPMKKSAAAKGGRPASTSKSRSTKAQHGKIHPVIIYPFKAPADYSDLESLYSLVARLDAEKEWYARPITVMDRKTHRRQADDKSFRDFRRNQVARHSTI